jgi:hypothetical protein
MDSVDYQLLANLGSLLIGLIGTILGIYFKNGKGKYGSLLTESVELMADVSMTVQYINEMRKDNVITPEEVEDLESMAKDLQDHAVKIQHELGLDKDV